MECNTSRVEYNSEQQIFMIGQYEFNIKNLYAHLANLTPSIMKRF